DATELNIEFLNRFDVIICDVPCSGMGVIKNKPEIKYKVDDLYIRKLTDLQLEILENSIKYLKPEGCLIYSTCTIDKRENEYNINRFLEKNPNFNLENIRLSNQFEKIQTGMIKILPDDYNCDGFFICKLRKNSKI
ncbi:16S rRNA (cytosine(967)-C(5))-methyltransferase RsmB, partial [Streptococcus danieliae]|nr:16S rRNA (cytosine(967)-C(5))-methyltransferase RsmB [Streptococcus danieliae]